MNTTSPAGFDDVFFGTGLIGKSANFEHSLSLTFEAKSPVISSSPVTSLEVEVAEPRSRV